MENRSLTEQFPYVARKTKRVDKDHGPDKPGLLYWLVAVPILAIVAGFLLSLLMGALMLSGCKSLD